jgi:hypothetical protein
MTTECRESNMSLVTNREIQGDQQGSVHLMITVHKTRKNILNSFNHLHDNVVRIMDNRWRWCESSVSLALAVGCQAVRLSPVVRWRTLWTLLVTFCIVIIRCTGTFWSLCICYMFNHSCHAWCHHLYGCVANIIKYAWCSASCLIQCAPRWFIVPDVSGRN